MSCVIFHPEMGIYLGSFIGFAFWSKLDAAGQDFAVTAPRISKDDSDAKSSMLQALPQGI